MLCVCVGSKYSLIYLLCYVLFLLAKLYADVCGGWNRDRPQAGGLCAPLLLRFSYGIQC